ncbi:hypothetical protein HPB48_005515 [Haemaphysalis longicornis]|uniref:Uncharacterized protein n=1 Tax=Haemaphysalis longicornis TaxID=44386 RepID=A0A9J6GSK9_HAELO|nr:hypothetical protein HPB48_005515 [Haemaphysalis longicornis]
MPYSRNGRSERRQDLAQPRRRPPRFRFITGRRLGVSARAPHEKWPPRGSLKPRARPEQPSHRGQQRDCGVPRAVVMLAVLLASLLGIAAASSAELPWTRVAPGVAADGCDPVPGTRLYWLHDGQRLLPAPDRFWEPGAYLLRAGREPLGQPAASAARRRGRRR